MTMDTCTQLRELAQSLTGRHMTAAAPDLDDLDWTDYYPVVNSDGVLTGEIAGADDPDYRVVDWSERYDRLEAGPWASSAMIRKGQELAR